MGWRRRLRALPLRTKVLITLTGAGVALLAATTYLSFGYWKTESVAAAEAHALLAAASVRVPVEQALRAGRTADARRVLRRLTETAPVTAARVYDGQGRVLVASALPEEGERAPATWLPAAHVLGDAGVARAEEEESRVRAFVPLHIPGDALLEVDFSLVPLQAAMRRGGRLATGLLFASLLAIALVVWAMLEREVVQPLERVQGLVVADGSVRPGDEVRRLAATVANLVEREQAAETRVAEQQKRLDAQAGLAEVGSLAAEMAHEFKRPLATIHTALSLLEQEYALDGRGQQLFDAVGAQLGHLTTSVQDLFTLAKPVALATERVDVRHVADAALSELSGHPSFGRAHVTRTYPLEPVEVSADARRLQQALQNLLLNAAEAMPGGGTVTLAVEQPSPATVVVSVSDTGGGMSPEMREQVMRPFYTTKPLGTGLGLPLVARVVGSHGGRVDIDSEVGVGTTVRVMLPAAQEERREP